MARARILITRISVRATHSGPDETVKKISTNARCPLHVETGGPVLITLEVIRVDALMVGQEDIVKTILTNVSRRVPVHRILYVATRWALTSVWTVLGTRAITTHNVLIQLLVHVVTVPRRRGQDNNVTVKTSVAKLAQPLR